MPTYRLYTITGDSDLRFLRYDVRNENQLDKKDQYNGIYLEAGSTCQQIQNICITIVQRRPNVFGVGPTLYKCYTNVLCLLGYQSAGGTKRMFINNMIT